MGWVYGILGGFVLFVYGIVPTFQPGHFHRTYAAYGGIFIVIALLWGWIFNGTGKAYIFNRRVHHGEVGILLGISNLFKKFRPDAAGVLSGFGETLSQDDIAGKEEWFEFKKKKNNINSEIPIRETKQDADQQPNAKGDERNFN